MLIRYQFHILHLDKKKIAGLIEKSIFKIVISADIPGNTPIFNSHFVDKVKHVGTDKTYKRSWLVVQVYNN